MVVYSTLGKGQNLEVALGTVGKEIQSLEPIADHRLVYSGCETYFTLGD